MPAERVRALDGLRGLAALSVVVAKYWAALPAAWHQHAPFNWAYVPPLTFLLNDRGAVILFFVLSGYVLSTSLTAKAQKLPEQLAPFLIRRLCRIWLPYAAVLTISGALWLLAWRLDLREPPELAPHYWSDPPCLPCFARQLAMQYAIPPLNTPGWSLVVEMQVSAVLPVLLIVLRKTPVLACATAVAATLAAEPADVRFFRFIIYFLVGALLALRGETILRGLRPVFGRLGPLLALAALGMLGLPPDRWYDELLMGIGAATLILLALANGRLKGFLLRNSVQLLGRVSYSLYLTSTVTLHAIGMALWHIVPVPIILVLGVPAISAATWGSYTLLERPTIALGRKLALKLREPALS